MLDSNSEDAKRETVSVEREILQGPPQGQAWPRNSAPVQADRSCTGGYWLFRSPA